MVCVLLQIHAQESFIIDLDRNHVSIQKNNSIQHNKLGVYRGTISEDNIVSATPMIGKITSTDTSVSFTPIVPFGWEEEYTLVYDGVIEYFKIKLPIDYKSLEVEKIYPSIGKLPSNVLKWYVKFSRPISETNVYDHIRIINANGDTLSRATLPLQNALISEKGTLLTIWVEPGRQKRGLGPNETLGAVFEKDHSYSLIISKTLKDDQGIKMKEDYVHSFEIIEADRTKPNVNNWKLLLPKVKSLEKLRVNVIKPLDFGSTNGSVKLMNDNNEEVRGTWHMENDETHLVFTPSDIWKKGAYKVLFDHKIEDLAGNNLKRLFDQEITQSSSIDHNDDEYKIEFVLR